MAEDNPLPEHVTENRRYWDDMADDWVSAGIRSWDQAQPTWGIWGLPEEDLMMLPPDMTGLRTIELGCGTGYVSGWMIRRGAECVGIDNSARQLATARRLADERGAKLNLIHGNAEAVPLPSETFDFAISEYGAAIWCDPYHWIPEATRLLKPGGHLVFLGNHPLAMITTPANGDKCEPTLHRDYFGLHRLDWRNVPIDPGGIEFNLPLSNWLQLFRDSGLAVIDYQELKAPGDMDEDRFSISAGWAKRWPSEQVWKLQKT